MAITFDPSTKIIQLDSFSSSEREIWTAFVDWAVQSDNLKYGVGMTQIGGVEPIALYIYLELGWKIRPVEADGITTITGNLLIDGGASPIAPTLGNFQTLVNMETPVKAVAISTSGGGGTVNVDEVVNGVADRINTDHGEGLYNRIGGIYGGRGGNNSAVIVAEINKAKEDIIKNTEKVGKEVKEDINKKIDISTMEITQNFKEDEKEIEKEILNKLKKTEEYIELEKKKNKTKAEKRRIAKMFELAEEEYLKELMDDVLIKDLLTK